MNDMRFSHRCERVKLPLEVMTLDVAVPLTLALDGDVAIFAIMTAVELTIAMLAAYTRFRVARVQLMACVLPVVHEQPTVHEPRSVCMSALLKVVAVLFEAAS
jgi:hypothetical protein